MANLLQSSQQQATSAPSYYTDYLSNLATQGTQDVNQAKFIGAQPLQQQAFQDVASAASAYQPTLQQAGSTLNAATSATGPLSAGMPYLQSATKSPADLAASYMSPYLSNVVNAIGDVGQRNIQQNLSPLATSGAVGSGQFGSQRGAQVLGQTLSNADRDILNQQYQALNTGYGQALTAAGQQNALQGQLGSTAGQLASAGQQNLTQLGNAQSNLAGQNQALGLADINALSTLGGQQQAIAQNEQLFPLTNLGTVSQLLRGYQIPTSTVTTANASPLSVLGGGVTGLAGLFTPVQSASGQVQKDANGNIITPASSLGTGISSAMSALSSLGKQLFPNNPSPSPSPTPTPTQVQPYGPPNTNAIDANGNVVGYYDENGELITY
jgi:hypothetical protein